MLSTDIKVEIDTAMLEKIIASVEKEAKQSVQVGWFDTGTHPDTLVKGQDKSTIAGVAWRNEFGIDRNRSNKEFGVPARPFIRPVINVRTRDEQIASLKRTATAAILLKDTSGRRRALGRFLSKSLKDAISNGTYLGLDENSPYIEKRKGFNFPLKGKTGLLRNTIKYKLSNSGVE